MEHQLRVADGQRCDGDRHADPGGARGAALDVLGHLVPDLAGYPIREAIRALIDAGLTVTIEGSGLVLHQDPPASSVVVRGTNVSLVLEPPT